MSFAFGHLIFAWLIGKSKEKISKIKLEKYGWFLLLFGAIFPDIDFLLDWTLGTHLHRTFTHSLFMIIISFIIVYLICSIFFKNSNKKRLAGLFAIGISSHLILDMIFGYPGISLLWPMNYKLWFLGILHGYTAVNFSEITKEHLLNKVRLAIFDMGLGVLWIGYLFFKNKIKEF